MNFMYGLSTPNVDHWAHAAGFGGTYFYILVLVKLVYSSFFVIYSLFLNALITVLLGYIFSIFICSWIRLIMGANTSIGKQKVFKVILVD